MISGLDHVNIRCRDLDATLAFYRDVLGMRAGPVPGMADAPRAWIYGGDGHPVLHVGSDAPRDDDPGKQTGSGAIDHVALACTGRDAMHGRIVAAGLTPVANDIPGIGLRQLFVHDPDGILLELNFREAVG